MTILDSGNRTEFESGAVRDMKDGVGRCDLLPACALIRISKHFQEGAKKYGDRNWEKGIPVHSFIDSALRHLFKYMDGQTDEDHLCASAWNLLCAMWTEEKRPDMIDIPAVKLSRQLVEMNGGKPLEKSNTPIVVIKHDEQGPIVEPVETHYLEDRTKCVYYDGDGWCSDGKHCDPVCQDWGIKEEKPWLEPVEVEDKPVLKQNPNGEKLLLVSKEKCLWFTHGQCGRDLGPCRDNCEVWEIPCKEETCKFFGRYGCTNREQEIGWRQCPLGKNCPGYEAKK